MSVPEAGPSLSATPAAQDAATALPTGPNGVVEQIPREFGRYRIIDRIGRGGMGAVFKAHDTQLDRTVALKVPFLGNDSGEIKQRFYREARAAATLHHPNICPVYDVGEFRGLPFLTMAFIEGKSLGEVVKTGQTIAAQQAALLCRKLAQAMQQAHSHGVIHRDLKPGNVLLQANSEPVIMDFGLARRHDDRASEGLTRQGDVIGTLEYMSPEQLDGDNAAVGPAADIYALGVLLYEILTGRRPFTGNTASMLASILLKPPPRPTEIKPDIPPQLEEICLKAMARKPEDRYPTMAEFAAALTEFIRSPRQGAPSRVTPAPVPPATPQSGATTPRPSAATRPVQATAVSPGSGRRVKPAETAAEAPPPEAPASGKSKKKSAARRKKEKPEKKSNLKIIVGAVAGAVVAVVGVVTGIYLKSGSGSPTAQQSVDYTPPAGNPVYVPPQPPPPKKDNTKQKDNQKQKASGAGKKSGNDTKKGPNPAKAPNPPVVHVQPDNLNLAVGDKQQVKLAIDRRGYKGSLTFHWEGPRELHVTPAGPVTVKSGDPDPVLSLQLMGEPTAAPRLAITATPASDSRLVPIKTQLAVHPAPGPCVRVLEVSSKPIDAMAFTPDGSLALVGDGGSSPPPKSGAKTGGQANAIHIWDLPRGQTLPALTGHAGRVTGLVVSGDGKTLLSISADQSVARWDVAGGQILSQSPRQQLPMLGVGVSPDGRRALAAYPGMLLKVDLEKFQPPRGQPPIDTTKLLGVTSREAIFTVALSGEQKGLAGGLDGKLFVIDMNDKVKPKPLTGLKEAIRCAVFVPKSTLAATGSGGVLQVGKLQPGKENAVCLWDATTAALKWKADELPAPVVCVAFDRGGLLLASGGADGEVRVWDAADGKPVATFKGHAGPVLALAFGPDGKTLYSGSADRTVRTWRLP